MGKKYKRTIEEVLNYETGEEIKADDFFKKPLNEIFKYRGELDKAIHGYRQPLFVCYYCKQPINIRGGKGSPIKRKIATLHFEHFKDSDECSIKTKGKFTKEEIERIRYNGAKESNLHINLKNEIASCLRINALHQKGISNVGIEEVIKNQAVSKEWKKPDINAIYHGKKLVIELQLSTTFLSVITERQHFYKENKIFILWVFHHFNLSEEIRKFTDNDVIYSNNQNAFVFDSEAAEKSKTENDLVLKCYYNTYSRQGSQITENWQSTFVKSSDLTFDETNYKIYYHDTENQRKEALNGIAQYNKELEESEKKRTLEENERVRKRRERMHNINLKKELIEEIKKQKEKLINQLDNLQDKIKHKVNAISKHNEFAEEIIKYLFDPYRFKPFYENNELLNSLKEHFAEQLKGSISLIKCKEKELKDLENRLGNVNELETVKIAGIQYKSIPLSNWDFIKSTYRQIKIIPKESAKQLFAHNELIPIKAEYDLANLQYREDLYFLIDPTIIKNEYTTLIE
ncbi:MAG: hypothetical protein HYV59_08375, partial [Planctomycetes bacterium]|nr:hypothetical protein [Planctomycetota bacterium]